MTARNEIAAKIVLLGFVGFFVVFFSRPHGRPPALGEVCPNFNLPTDDGQTVTLTDFRGKIVILNFWATWCPPCVDEVPSLNRLALRYADKGLAVLGVSVDEDPDAYRSFLAKHQIVFQTVRNSSRAVSERYGTFKLPESYIISRDGRLLNKVIGGTDWTDKEMISYFDGLLSGS